MSNTRAWPNQSLRIFTASFNAVGITMAQAQLVKTADEAINAAKAIGFPVALKAAARLFSTKQKPAACA